MSGGLSLLARGAGAGALATVAMSAEMLAAQRLGVMGEQPPERIAEDAAEEVTGSQPDEGTTDVLASVAHFAFGAAGGAGYALILGRSARSAGPVTGIVFGLLVWAASYAGWIPALGILPPPDRDRPGRQVAMVLAHVIYGSVLGALVGRSARRF